MTRFAVIGSLVLLLAVFAGCSGSDKNEPTPAPSVVTPTAVPTEPTTATTVPTNAATPTRTPPATATKPAATATPTPTNAPARPATLISNGPRGSGMVALTLDMGGRVDPAVEIVHWLIDQRVPATIFMTGAMAANANTDAGREVLRLVAAHPELFVLGNHSYSHPDFREISSEAMADEIHRTETAIRAVAPLDPRPWFRPPFGAVDADVLAGVGAAGYSYAVMWDVDTIDWKPESDGGPTTDQIVAKVLANARSGSIVLMHLGGYNTLDALPRIVAGLRAEGLVPATLPALIGQ